jgi:hypothetical protein
MSKSVTRSKIDLEFDFRIRTIAGFELAGLGLISAKGGSTDTTAAHDGACGASIAGDEWFESAEAPLLAATPAP